MTQAVVHQGRLPERVVFGPGAMHALVDECGRLGLRRVLLVGGDALLARVSAAADRLDKQVAGVFTDVAEHVPQRNADAVVDAARIAHADGVVGIGGGSTLGLGKVVALRLGLPLVAVPTTYAGSEMTSIYGITTDTGKQVGADPRVLPTTVLYDPLLTVTLPASLTAASGMNALAHCVEALWLPAGPFAHAFAERGIRELSAGLPVAVAAPEDPQARQRLMLGASLAGAALGLAGTGLHHKICHVLGGRYRLPHAGVHSVVLPHVVAYNTDAAPAAVCALGRSLAQPVPARDAAAALFELAATLPAPTRLAELNLPEETLPEVAAVTAAADVPNPAPLREHALLSLLVDAYHGQRPTGV